MSEFVTCFKCGGTGNIPWDIASNASVPATCNICGGKGKLDWIENVIGKRSSYVYAEPYLDKNGTMSFRKKFYIKN